MSWIETITKEGFQLAVKEAMRPDMEKIENRLSQFVGPGIKVARLDGRKHASL